MRRLPSLGRQGGAQRGCCDSTGASKEFRQSDADLCNVYDFIFQRRPAPSTRGRRQIRSAPNAAPRLRPPPSLTLAWQVRKNLRTVATPPSAALLEMQIPSLILDDNRAGRGREQGVVVPSGRCFGPLHIVARVRNRFLHGSFLCGSHEPPSLLYPGP